NLVGSAGNRRPAQNQILARQLHAEFRPGRDCRFSGCGKAEVIDCQSLRFACEVWHFPYQPERGSRWPSGNRLIQYFETDLVDSSSAIYRSAADRSRTSGETYVQVLNQRCGIGGKWCARGRINPVMELNRLRQIRLTPQFARELQVNVIQIATGLIDEFGPKRS